MVTALSIFRDTWIGDGTFKLVPSHFYQLYTVHIHLNENYPPCIYALFSNLYITYRKFLAVVKDISENCVPSRILIDFEKAALNAFKEIYWESSVSGCYFHFCQSFQRKIADLGIKRFYPKNADFAVAIKTIPWLAFIPVAEVEKAFELVVD